MTSSNGNIFRVTGHLCGEFTGHRWIPRTSVQSVFFSGFAKNVVHWLGPGNAYTWWRHQMETFSALLAIFAGNSPVNSPHKGQWRGALMFSLSLNKRLGKQWWGWWFETPSRPLWRHCKVMEQCNWGNYKIFWTYSWSKWKHTHILDNDVRISWKMPFN